MITISKKKKYSKSKEQFIQKISRGLGDREGEYDMTRFNDYDLNAVRDEAMMVYVEKLKSNTK